MQGKKQNQYSIKKRHQIEKSIPDLYGIPFFLPPPNMFCCFDHKIFVKNRTKMCSTEYQDYNRFRVLKAIGRQSVCVKTSETFLQQFVVKEELPSISGKTSSLSQVYHKCLFCSAIVRLRPQTLLN